MRTVEFSETDTMGSGEAIVFKLPELTLTVTFGKEIYAELIRNGSRKFFKGNIKEDSIAEIVRIIEERLPEIVEIHHKK